MCYREVKPERYMQYFLLAKFIKLLLMKFGLLDDNGQLLDGIVKLSLTF